MQCKWLKPLPGAEAVLNSVGPVKGARADLMTISARNIIAAMRQHHVRRLIALTGAGIGDEKDQPKLADKVITLLLKTFNGAAMQDSTPVISD